MITKHRSPSTPRPLDTHPPIQNIMWRHHPIPERNLQRQHPLSARTHRPMSARNHIGRINSDEESVRPAFHQKPVEAGRGGDYACLARAPIRFGYHWAFSIQFFRSVFGLQQPFSFPVIANVRSYKEGGKR
ncbi:hypothetical protein I7I48_10897 [Histoplasma ohiense]|nr:hypothetical protein I7I48_10897 [Histoplasma ohiense (nom. inval.)]